MPTGDSSLSWRVDVVLQKPDRTVRYCTYHNLPGDTPKEAINIALRRYFSHPICPSIGIPLDVYFGLADFIPGGWRVIRAWAVPEDAVGETMTIEPIDTHGYGARRGKS